MSDGEESKVQHSEEDEKNTQVAVVPTTNGHKESVQDLTKSFAAMTIPNLWEMHRRKLLHGMPPEHIFESIATKTIPDLCDKFSECTAGNIENGIVGLHISFPVKVASYNDPGLVNMKMMESIVKDSGKRYLFKSMLRREFEEIMDLVLEAYGVPESHDVFTEIEIVGISEDMTIAQLEINIANLWF